MKVCYVEDNTLIKDSRRQATEIISKTTQEIL